MHRCFLCGSESWIEIHHVFGASNRKNSEKHGLVVPLCHYCHNEPPLGVHHNKDRNLMLKKIAQHEFEKAHTRDEFMLEFGKNYLWED